MDLHVFSDSCDRHVLYENIFANPVGNQLTIGQTLNLNIGSQNWFCHTNPNFIFCATLIVGNIMHSWELSLNANATNFIVKSSGCPCTHPLIEDRN